VAQLISHNIKLQRWFVSFSALAHAYTGRKLKDIMKVIRNLAFSSIG